MNCCDPAALGLRWVALWLLRGYQTRHWEQWEGNERWQQARNIFVPAALQILPRWVLLLWANLPHSVINPCKPCEDFQSGEGKDGETCKLIRDAFDVVPHWRRNSFLVPSVKAGKDFVLEFQLVRLYQAYADNTTLHSVALSYRLLCVSETATSEASYACQK